MSTSSLPIAPVLPLSPMDLKAPIAALHLYKELRVDLDPSLSDTLVHIQLPSTSAFNRSTQPQHRIITTLPPHRSEKEYKSRYVASSSGVFFRRLYQYPRSILWRCLEDNNVLELRSIDLSLSKKKPREATVIVRIGLPSPIRSGGIALADAVDHDVFNAFVLTQSNELFTFAIRPDLFFRPPASVEAFERYYQVHKPSSFVMSAPHRLFACNPLLLLVALADGRLMRLERKLGEDGSQWQEFTYHDGQWGASLRGLIRWQGSNAVRYNGVMLDQSSPLSVACSPDGRHLFAVCLNHTLKAWSQATGNPIFSKDLLNTQREPQSLSKVFIDPSCVKLLQIFTTPNNYAGDEYYILTLSPHDSGVFKVWAVRDADHGDSEIRDLYPDHVLRAPDPDDGAVWTLADFRIKSSRAGKELELWILLRLNKRYKLYNKRFELAGIQQHWHHDWTATATDIPKWESFFEPPPEASEIDSAGSTELWLEHIFFPGRFSEVILEAALSVYIQSRKLQPTKNFAHSLKSRIASVVGSNNHLSENGVDETAYSFFRHEVCTEWLFFWSIICDLDQSRWEPCSLGYDEYADTPWIVFGNGCSAVRQCSPIELLVNNKSDDLNEHMNRVPQQSVETEDTTALPGLPHELALLINAATSFRASFSDSLRTSCNNVTKSEVWQDSSVSVPIRIQALYSRCKFDEEISNRQYNDLVAALQGNGGLQGLATEHFHKILHMLPRFMSTEISGLQSTTFGLRLLIKGAQETIALHTQILTDLLYLIVFVDMEIGQEVSLMEGFDASRIYMELIELLKQYEMMQWLVKNTRRDPSDQNKNGVTADVESGLMPASRVSTILENLFAVDTDPQSYDSQPQSASITHGIHDLLKWVTGGNDSIVAIDQVLVHIQCNLLKNKNLDLASSFEQFLPSTAWATYIRGRLCLSQNKYSNAVVYFEKAAYKLSRPNPQFSYPSASSYFLDPLSASFLSTGLTNYYVHVISLFEPLRAHLHISHFAQLALRQSISKSSQQYSDLLARLFHSSLAVLDFSSAYSALLRYTDNTLQRSGLASLVHDMVSKGYTPELLALPFLTLKAALDNHLAEKAKQELTASIPSSHIPYYRVLYALRLREGDFRGAAAALIERLEGRNQQRPQSRGHREHTNDGVLDDYLVLINALAVVGGDSGGWVFAGEDGKRKVVGLEDARKSYQEEHDRRSVLESGRFGILGSRGDDEMELL